MEAPMSRSWRCLLHGLLQRKGASQQGIVSGGIGAGLFLAGIILPPIISAFGKDGWRYAWYFLGIAVFVLGFVCYAFLRNHPSEKGLTMFGGIEEQKGGPKVTLFSAFKDVVVEAEIWKLGVVYFMYGFSYIIYLTFFVAFLTKEMGMTPIAAGRVFAVLGVFSIFCGVIYGWISDVVGRRYGSMIAYLTLALAYVIFAFWKDTYRILCLRRRLRDRRLLDPHHNGGGIRGCGRRPPCACRPGIHNLILRDRPGAGAARRRHDQRFHGKLYGRFSAFRRGIALWVHWVTDIEDVKREK